jgi:hypothetical protein
MMMMMMMMMISQRNGPINFSRCDDTVEINAMQCRSCKVVVNV